MSDPKKHHYLPQFYLRGFADAAEKLRLYRETACPTAIPTCVRNSGCENQFHTLDWSKWGDKPDDRSSIESMLSRIEGQQAETLRCLLEGHQPIEACRDDVAQFVGMMWHRVPSIKRDIESSVSKILSHAARSMLKAGMFPPPPDELKSLIDEHDGDIFLPKIANWMLIKMMFDRLHDSPVIHHLACMNARIVRPESADDFFVTGDRPVSIFDGHWTPSSTAGVGFASPTVEVSMPLSASCLIVLRHDNALPPPSLTRPQVRHYNQRVIVSSSRFVYSPLESETIAGDIHCLHDQRCESDDFNFAHHSGHVFVTRNRPITQDQLTCPLV